MIYAFQKDKTLWESENTEMCSCIKILAMKPMFLPETKQEKGGRIV